MAIAALIVGILDMVGTYISIAYTIGKDIHRNDDNTRK